MPDLPGPACLDLANPVWAAVATGLSAAPPDRMRSPPVRVVAGSALRAAKPDNAPPAARCLIRRDAAPVLGQKPVRFPLRVSDPICFADTMTPAGSRCPMSCRPSEDEPVPTITRGLVTFRSDARRLAVGAPNGDLTIWDTALAHCPTLISRIRRGRGIRAVAWNPAAARLLATSSADRTATIWQTVDDRPPRPVTDAPLHLDDPHHLGWLADGQYLFCVARQGRTTIWHSQDPRQFRQSQGPDRGAVIAAYPTPATIMTVTADGWACSWDPWQDRWQASRLGGAPILACARSGSLVALARPDGLIDIVDQGLRLMGTVRIRDGDAPQSMAMSEDGDVLVALYRDGTMIACESTGGVRWRIPPEPDRAATAVDVAGGLVALGGQAARPQIVDIEAGTKIGAA